VMQRI